MELKKAASRKRTTMAAESKGVLGKDGKDVVSKRKG